MKRASAILCTFFMMGTYPVLGGFDPQNGDWDKTEPTDLRVMTWNVEDCICRTNDKTETAGGGRNNWHALSRIIAAMRPDVLILQETGDNSGNGTGSGVDNIGQLLTTVDLLLHGGTDVFLGGAVTAYVQKYAPGYDLPHVYVSTATDGFNRNIILSRYPFVDLNGDGISTMSTLPFILADEYADSGNGGIRGYMLAEIDLPPVYQGDVVVGNGHLKSGGSSSDLAQRLEASQQIAYIIDYWYNGAGSGVPDPNNRIQDSPVATSILDPLTPVIVGGDWNEDEDFNGRRGPALWITEAEEDCDSSCSSPVDDGTDRDRTDATFDEAVHPFNGSRATLGGSKLDYLAWQDSIATDRNSFVFNTSGIPFNDMPPELTGYPLLSAATGDAADHRPVIVDLLLPLSGIGLGACCNLGICSDDQAQLTCESAGGVFQGDDTDCAMIMCPPPTGACCDGDTCSDGLTDTECLNAGGVYQGPNTDCGSISCAAVTINELRIDQAGTENDEYIELTAEAGTPLDGLTLLVIGDGVGGTGIVESIVPLDGQTVPVDGHFLVAESTFSLLGLPDLVTDLVFENSDNVTHLLVSGFTGMIDQDLDVDDNGILDTEPWATLVDCVGLSENFPIGDQIYCATIVGPDNGDVPAHAYRCPDGDGEWQIGNESTGPLDTPGQANPCSSGACCTGGSCEVLMQTECTAGGGSFAGDGTDCVADDDNDTVPDACDACPGFDDLVDTDNDGVANGCDPCPDDNPDDSDVDGVCDSTDACPGFDDNVDGDADGVADGCDACAGFDDNLDDDLDTVPNGCDACPGFDDGLDGDEDSIPDDCDNCPVHANNDQANCDDIGAGDVCEIATGAAQDCNTNTVPDDCDIADGTSLDDNMDGVPDECDTCATIADCADTDANGIRDDGCVFWTCEDGVCVGTDIGFGDMGGAFGVCPVDGTTDGNDRFQALNCFANIDPNGGPGDPFLCEDDPPAAMNVDAGGSFGSCVPDGVCDGNDAFLALGVFDGSSTCSCGPAPLGPQQPVTTAKAAVSLIPESSRIKAGQIFEVDTWLDTPLDDLRGYQLHVGVSGGKAGGLELIDITLSQNNVLDSAGSSSFERTRRQAPRTAWQAFNLQTAQMVVGIDQAGIAVRPGYLATFTFQAGRNASGAFIIDLNVGDATTDRTFLFPTRPGEKIALSTTPARVTVRR